MDYVQGRGSFATIAQRYSVDESTIKRWASAERWTELRADWDAEALKAAQTPPPANPPAAPVLSPQQARIVRLEEEMEEIEKAMKGAVPEAKVRLALAHSKLFAAWQVLTSTPNPGSRRVGKGGRSGVSVPTPAEPVETPQAQNPQVPIA